MLVNSGTDGEEHDEKDGRNYNCHDELRLSVYLNITYSLQTVKEFYTSLHKGRS